MLINDLAREIHANAVAHGWWDEPRDIYEIDALIHSEWSEALEEARAGMPMVYAFADGKDVFAARRIIEDLDVIADEGLKPEGIAVELIDGCIRILDFMGECDAQVTGGYTDIEELWETMAEADIKDIKSVRIGLLISMLHKMSSECVPDEADCEYRFISAISVIRLALGWIYARGLDPMALLMLKHNYNKTRPYKHGKKF